MHQQVAHRHGQVATACIYATGDATVQHSGAGAIRGGAPGRDGGVGPLPRGCGDGG